MIVVGAPLYCPECEQPAKLDHTETQWQTDIPSITTVTTEFRIEVSRCTKCGRSLRDRHPEQISEATGATGVQIGPRAIAMAAKLNKECGVSYGRIADVFGKAFGLHVDRSTLARALMRLSKTMKPLYEKIGQNVRSAPMLSPDETGWKIGGHKAWLHVAATREDSFYLIARGRGRKEAEALIGKDYRGTLVRDGWAPYRMFTAASSQSCLAHILRRIDGLLEIDSDPAAGQWLTELKKLFQHAIVVRDRRDAAQVGPHGLMISIGRIEAKLDRLLEDAPADEGASRLAKHLQRERSALLTFLWKDAVPATNFLAEQALRPAVVNRKMSGGNNTEPGANSQAILMTMFHSAKKRSADALSIAVAALRRPTCAADLLPSPSGR